VAIASRFARSAHDVPLQFIRAFQLRRALHLGSNAHFDQWLKARGAASGNRNFENVDALARSYGCVLQHGFAMPANNHTLVGRRLSETTG